MNEDNRAERALQMILDACATQRYVAPFELVVSDAGGTRIAARFDHDGAELLAGDFGSIGLMRPPLGVFVTDARGESAEFSVELCEAEDGQKMAPIVIYPNIGLNPGLVASINECIWLCTLEFPTIAIPALYGCRD